MITLASASAEGLIIFMHNGTVSEAKLQETRFQTRVNLAAFFETVQWCHKDKLERVPPSRLRGHMVQASVVSEKIGTTTA